MKHHKMKIITLIAASVGLTTPTEAAFHPYWLMTCTSKIDTTYDVLYDSVEGSLTLISDYKRQYPVLASTQKNGWFEVFASRPDQDRSLLAVFNGDRSALIVTGKNNGADRCKVTMTWDYRLKNGAYIN